MSTKVYISQKYTDSIIYTRYQHDPGMYTNQKVQLFSALHTNYKLQNLFFTYPLLNGKSMCYECYSIQGFFTKSTEVKRCSSFSSEALHLEFHFQPPHMLQGKWVLGVCINYCAAKHY